MKEQKWLLDSAASHNITGDLQNLSFHSEYDSTDEVVLGDGSGLAVSHVGSLAIHSPNRTFILRDTLYEPITGAILLRGSCENGIYIFPESLVGNFSQKVANVHEQTSLDGWHKRLGHPSYPIPVRVPPQVIPSVHSSDSAPSHVLQADVSAASPSPPGNPPLSSPNFPLTDVLRNSGSHSDVLISHDPILPSSLHPTHTHTVADLTLSQSHSIPPSCVQTGNPRLHKMTTRSMNNIFKPKQLHLVSKHPIPLAIEPTCVTQVVNHPQWRDAMSTELTALMKHGTWDLVPPPPPPPPPNCTPVGYKWVFRVKRKADGSVDKFKARLVAKGYTQRPGLDYKETFSLVVRPATIRCVLTIAVMNGWPLRQMDINNAFLHGTLTETVYMMQPPGFKDTSKPDHLGFKNSKADSSLFIYTHGPIICYFLVYVDDLVITGNDIQFVDHIIQKLGENFSLKDMGNLSFFLGVEVIPTRAGLFLSQHQYICDLLFTTNMLGAKDVSTPLSTTASLKLFDGTAPVDSTDFRRVIGSLQYLSLTRLDILFALTRNTTSVLTTFSDADWAGNVDDRTSTSAYISFLGTNPISWSSKKQRAVARSSTEAEYRALANAASETVWLNSLLHELGFPLKVPPLLLCDNLGATHLSFNPVNHSRMKHIQIDLHFVRELVQNGTLHVRHVHTQDQLADLLTKPLSRQRTELLRTKIGLADGSSILRGRIKEDCQNQDQVKPS
ncbi:Retrovirus-related Pol polyprotein from transposon RE2 [Vitis vinifera]|uniref:Retrovirus-related Pol polyprotein from transposon RE2 n=1 Tax=Vitis vinifera TaxID=29760 RepID=A0A438G7N2_VITVI|nr:Retrovirus-related Pol polyprotein from transposon RE2 [Vitis vinifera]